ncbi:hypothetical protein ACJRO7_015824 [Eucalyptus globulus]|uniref:Uncharacterized protein n=1 Tax=Eucalyptus globulus TaxID=34317 RepID=A0ABD3L8S2_EUCGL
MKRVYANLALLSLLSISFSFFLPTAFSRTKLTSPTVTLDVSGSLQNTRGVLSFDPQSQTSFSEKEQRQEQTSSGSLSVRLHPRESLVRTPYKEYKALVLARLGRDSARVGDFVTETVSFGDSGAVNNVALGCGHDNEGLFMGSASLLGLGGAPCP